MLEFLLDIGMKVDKNTAATKKRRWKFAYCRLRNRKGESHLKYSGTRVLIKYWNAVRIEMKNNRS